MMRKSWMIAGGLALTGLAASVLMPVEQAFAGDQLTITAFGGAGQEGLRKAMFEPFAKKTGIKITEDEYNGGSSKIRAMVESKTVSWDVVFADATAAAQMCADGILERIDWNKVGLDRSKFLGGDTNDCAVPSDVYATLIAYDKDKLPNGPKTIADLFDTQKFPGKRGLFKRPGVNLEWALIADGVAIKDVYKVLSTPAGVDRAFRKLDTIKKDVVWWESGAQPPQLLADGQVIMTSAWITRIYDAVKNSGKRFEIMWDGEALGMNVWVIPKGTPRLDDAYKYIAFAASPAAQAELTRYAPAGPANKDAIPLVDPAMLPHMANAPDNMRNALLFSTDFWADKSDELLQRFSAWVAK